MLITFEGPDGSGKTTQLALLEKYLNEQGYSILRLREPGGTPISEQIRDVIHDLKNQEMSPRAEVLLYTAARAQLVEQVIRPALGEGKIILCDRFYDSTFAYQGYGHGLDADALRALTSFAVGGLKPHLTIYIDITPEEGLKRRQRDADAEWNRLDAYSLAFHQRVHDGYQRLIEAEPKRWVAVDGDRPVEAIQDDIRQIVMAKLKTMNHL